MLNDLSPKSGFPDGVERFVSAGWGGNLPRLCTSASPSRPLIPNPSTSPNAVWDPETHFRWEGLLYSRALLVGHDARRKCRKTGHSWWRQCPFTYARMYSARNKLRRR